jgi:hypothetical protein
MEGPAVKSLRVQITIRELLIAVSVVALNCAVARHYYPTLVSSRRSYLEWADQLEVMVGLSPLINVAMVSATVLLLRRLNSLRCGPGKIDGRSLAEFTYFSVHLVVLGCLTCFVMPGIFNVYREFLRPMTNAVDGIALRFLSEKTNPHGWLLVQCVMLGLYLSGPPIVLSYLGGMMAKRSGATLSRRRFLAMTCLVSLGFVGTALAVVVTPQPFRDYYHDVTLDFQIVDKDSGKPIGASFILIKNAFHSFVTPARALTGPDGRARLTPRLLACGERNVFRTMGGFESWGQWLEISAAGYQTRRNALIEVFGPFGDLERPRVVRVALTRGTTEAGSFQDVAGRYRRFTIEQDGRFVYCDSGGCFGTPHEEYGYLRRTDDGFALRFIPHAGVEPDIAVTVPYRAIRWGDRLYFCRTDDRTLEWFCRASLLAEPSLLYWVADCRDTDRDWPHTDLPRLPVSVWVRFALSEVNPANQDSTLREAVANLGSHFASKGIQR